MRPLVGGAVGFVLLVIPALAGVAEAGPRDRFDRALRGVRDLRAGFRQERVSSLTSRREVSTGTLEYRRPRQVRLTYAGQEGVTIVLRDEEAWVYQPSQKVVTHSTVTGLAGTPAAILDESVASLERRYRVRERGSATLELTPQPGEEQPWRRIDVVLGASGLPNRLEIRESGGGRVVFRFQNLRVNSGVPASRFRPSFPSDVEIVTL